MKKLLKNNSDDLKKIMKVVDKLDINFGTNNNININNEIKDNDNIKEKLITNILKEISTGKYSDDDINIDNNMQIENVFYNKLERIKGNIKILKTYAGHNGWLSEEEIEQYYLFLLSSRILG